MRPEELMTKASEFQCSFELKKTGNPDWLRLFVIDSRGYTIGRFSVYRGNLYGLKNYKKGGIKYLGEADRIFNRINRYTQDRTIISLEEYEDLTVKAKEICHEYLRKKKEWRRDNPKYDREGNPKRRKRLQGKDLRRTVACLVMSYNKMKYDKELHDCLISCLTAWDKILVLVKADGYVDDAAVTEYTDTLEDGSIYLEVIKDKIPKLSRVYLRCFYCAYGEKEVRKSKILGCCNNCPGRIVTETQDAPRGARWDCNSESICWFRQPFAFRNEVARLLKIYEEKTGYNKETEK